MSSCCYSNGLWFPAVMRQTQTFWLPLPLELVEARPVRGPDDAGFMCWARTVTAIAPGCQLSPSAESHLLLSSQQSRAPAPLHSPTFRSPSVATRAAALSRKCIDASTWISFSDMVSQCRGRDPRGKSRWFGGVTFSQAFSWCCGKCQSSRGRWGAESKLHFGLVPSAPHTPVTAATVGHRSLLFFSLSHRLQYHQFMDISGDVGVWAIPRSESLSWTVHGVGV